MGALSKDEGEKSPAAKILRVGSPKAVPVETSPKIVAPGGQGKLVVEAQKDLAPSEDNRGAGAVHTVKSGETLAPYMSEEHPPEETLDKTGELA